MKFSEKIRTLMDGRSLSQYAMSRRLDVSTSMIHGWLNGSRPQRRIADKLAKFFEVSVDELMDDSKPCPVDIYGGTIAKLEEASRYIKKTYPDNKAAAEEAGESTILQLAYEMEQKKRQKENERIAKVLRDLADSICPPSKKPSRN